jgi:hypothetical protein
MLFGVHQVEALCLSDYEMFSGESAKEQARRTKKTKKKAEADECQIKF